MALLGFVQNQNPGLLNVANASPSQAGEEDQIYLQQAA
jgi:hypothetical protein